MVVSKKKTPNDPSMEISRLDLSKAAASLCVLSHPSYHPPLTVLDRTGPEFFSSRGVCHLPCYMNTVR